MERWVQRSFLDAKKVRGDLLDVRRDRIAMHLAARAERFEHEQIESALEDVVLGLRHVNVEVKWMPNKLCITSWV